jgi:hypothetical protein
MLHLAEMTHAGDTVSAALQDVCRIRLCTGCGSNVCLLVEGNVVQGVGG